VEDSNRIGLGETMAHLSDLLGPDRRLAFDNDDILYGPDDEDLQNDPVSQIDMQVRLILSLRSESAEFWGRQAHLVGFFRECAARNTSNFSAIVEQLNVEEMLVIHRILGD
jgi:hypothetical protein